MKHLLEGWPFIVFLVVLMVFIAVCLTGCGEKIVPYPYHIGCKNGICQLSESKIVNSNDKIFDKLLR